MDVSLIVPGAGGGLDVPARDERGAAEQFEALLIGQLLRAARESPGSGGWFGAGEDRSGESMAEFAEQQVALLLSRSGGLGLARLIEQGLTRSNSSPPAHTRGPAA